MHLIQHRFGIYCKNQSVHIDSGSWSCKQTFCLEGRKERERERKKKGGRRKEGGGREVEGRRRGRGGEGRREEKITS